jgi:benzil reductase ((S)-benzoin forming)
METTSSIFITGTSRGIGKAIAELLLLQPENQVVGIGRTSSIQHPRYTHVAADLSEVSALKSWEFPDLTNQSKIVLINNAGMIGGVRYAGRMDAETSICACHLNLVAPILLTNAFLRTYGESGAELVVLNISSGAAKNPIDGWSVYCASKAGLDHFTRTVAAEQQLRGKSNVHLFSVAPGIVDTAMQEEIRAADSADFSRIEQFIDYKKSDQLADPVLTARRYLPILESPKNFRETVFSVKDIPATLP